MPIRDRSLDFRISEIERRLDDMRAGKGAISGDGVDTFLRSGSFIVSGGDIEVLDNGDIIIDGGELRAVSGATTRTLLDRDRLRLNRADGTRQVEITPAGGMKVYAANGTTVRTVLDADGVNIDSGKVLLNSSGLEVDGGNSQAIWGHVDEENTADVSLGSTAITSSATNILSVVVDPPNWVQQLYLFCSADMMVTNSTGSPHRMDMRVIVDDGGASSAFSGNSQEKEANGISRSVSASQSLIVPLSPAGRSVTVTLRGTLSSGSSSTNRFRLNVMAQGVRDAFV
jgi:hypothetical protein